MVGKWGHNMIIGGGLDVAVGLGALVEGGGVVGFVVGVNVGDGVLDTSWRKMTPGRRAIDAQARLDSALNGRVVDTTRVTVRNRIRAGTVASISRVGGGRGGRQSCGRVGGERVEALCRRVAVHLWQSSRAGQIRDQVTVRAAHGR